MRCLNRFKAVDLNWYAIGLFWAGAAILFTIHLTTGRTPDPVGFTLMGLEIYWYGVLIVGGIALGAHVTGRLAQRWGQERLHVWRGLGWVLALGIVGGRVYHILTPPPSMATLGLASPTDYFQNPFQMLNVRNGGLGIDGAILGGLVGIFIYCRRARLNPCLWMDLAGVGAALGQSIGRWGNFINQELYGRATTLPWGIKIDLVTLAEYDHSARFQPTFLYASLWNFANFVLLYTLARRYTNRLRPGDLTALYLVFYSIGRILIIPLRLDRHAVTFGDDFVVPSATIVAALFILLAFTWRLVDRRVFLKIATTE